MIVLDTPRPFGHTDEAFHPPSSRAYPHHGQLTPWPPGWRRRQPAGRPLVTLFVNLNNSAR